LVSKTYGDKVIVVGEAAGQVKTTTGGGIAFGLLCSEIAGRVISQSRLSGSFSSRSLADYERQWRKAIQREIIVGYYARQFGARLNELQIERMFQIARSDGIIPMIKKDGNFDWQADLIFNLMRRFSYFRVF
jgi:flavin-dependent dehydrogenase